MKSRILLPLALLLAVPAAALVVEVNLPYKNLRLKDGMLFSDASVRSLNTSAGTVVLLVGKDLVSVRTSVLPDEVNARLKELTPVLSKEELEEEKKQEAADRKKAVEKAERRQKMAEEEAMAARAANRSQNVKVVEQSATRESSLREEVAKFAEARTRVFFKYQDDPHSNIGAVVGSDILLEKPELVPGWPGRYRVEGVAYRQYINNQASGFGRGGKEFEMLIQTSDREGPEVVEIRIK